MRVNVQGAERIADLERDLREIRRRAPRDMNQVVRDNAYRGNAIAKAFASEQHTMFSDYDIDYPPSFTVEKLGPARWEYGPDADIGDGSKSPGYEHGSINSPPHHDLARSADIQVPEFHLDVEDMVRGWFWPS